MLELTSGEWEWVVRALEGLPSLEEQEHYEIAKLLHKIKDADIWGAE